jgi:hypothetical protein
MEQVLDIAERQRIRMQIITAKRMISGEFLKSRKVLRRVMRERYPGPQQGSSLVALTEPTLPQGLFIWFAPKADNFSL